MESKYIILDDGVKVWHNSLGQLHNENGPAIEEPDGTKYWCINNKLHRENGPAIEWSDGVVAWYINGEAQDFPLEKPDGTKEWRNLNGQLHHDKGPAIIYPDGSTEYWTWGIQIQEDIPKTKIIKEIVLEPIITKRLIELE